MTARTQIERIPVAHDGDWFYLVDEDNVEKAFGSAEQVRDRRTRVGRYLAARQLKNMITHQIDLQVDDTDELYIQAVPYTAEEISAELLKAAE